jgi:hypothetical protein
MHCCSVSRSDRLFVTSNYFEMASSSMSSKSPSPSPPSILDSKQRNEIVATAIASNSVAECERDWWLQQRPLIWNEQQLIIDIGITEAKLCMEALATLPANVQNLKSMLAWPGASTRWRSVLQWLQTIAKSPPVASSSPSTSSSSSSSSSTSTTKAPTTTPTGGSSIPANASEALLQYARHLGRVTSYRSLALTLEQFNAIKANDSIYPTGRLVVILLFIDQSSNRNESNEM